MLYIFGANWTFIYYLTVSVTSKQFERFYKMTSFALGVKLHLLHKECKRERKENKNWDKGELNLAYFPKMIPDMSLIRTDRSISIWSVTESFLKWGQVEIIVVHCCNLRLWCGSLSLFGPLAGCATVHRGGIPSPNHQGNMITQLWLKQNAWSLIEDSCI